jgi:hypothetical protein
MILIGPFLTKIRYGVHTKMQPSPQGGYPGAAVEGGISGDDHH